MTSFDRFPVPVRSAVKSNFTHWCCQNLSKGALNALTVQASTTELGKLFQTITMRAEKNVFVSHNEKNDFAIYSVAETLDDKKTILALIILFINKLVDQVEQSVVNICDI